MKLLEALDHMTTEADVVRNSVTVSREKALSEGYGGAQGYLRYNAARKPSGDYLRALKECARLITGVKSGIISSWKLQEAMTTSDFPLLLGDLQYKQLLGFYTPYRSVYESISKGFNLKDFKPLNLYTIDGGSSTLDVVTEEAPYPEISFTEGRYQLTIKKYGRRYGLSFELIVNDDLDAMASRPAQMAIGARRTEERLMTGLYVDANGPHASFYTSGNKNIVTANPVLSIPGLQTAMTVLASQVDADGEPILIEGYTLVVPPALEVTANNILNGLQLRLHEAGGSTNTELITTNWMTQRLKLVVNPYIPIIGSGSNKNRMWFIFANPATGSRPALAHGFLRGRSAPQLYIKNPDQMLIGGGTADVMEGNFDNDGVDYKLRHFFGGIRVDPKMTVASSGAGS